MDKQEAVALVKRSLPKFAAAGLPPLSVEAIAAVQPKRIASLWAGMGSVWQLNVSTSTAGAPPLSIVAKRVELPAVCTSIGDQRKKDSYDVEAAFYSRGHADRLLAAGALVPYPLHVEHRPGEGVTICMTRVEGRSSHRGDSEAFVAWLAKLHATYWGSRADEACGGGAGGGLQAQGCYWHLDTRPEEHARMGSSGWMGRLRLAARAIDLRLKADPLQVGRRLRARVRVRLRLRLSLSLSLRAVTAALTRALTRAVGLPRRRQGRQHRLRHRRGWRRRAPGVRLPVLWQGVRRQGPRLLLQRGRDGGRRRGGGARVT